MMQNKAVAGLTIAFGLMLGLVSQADADIIFYSGASASTNFQASQAAGGRFQVSSGGETVEDFEWTNNTNVFQDFTGPLRQGVANGPFTSGLALPFTVALNASSPGTTYNPAATGTLRAASAGYAGATSDIVRTNTNSGSSLDLIFDPSTQVTGVGFNLISINGTGTGGFLDVRVYNTSGVQLIPNPAPSNYPRFAADNLGTQYLGITVTGTDRIGRVNLARSLRLEGVDNVTMYTALSPVPEPGTYAMFGLGLAGLAAVSFRKRKAERNASVAVSATASVVS